MIGKIITGANFKGVLRYNEKENAEIIAKNVAGENQKELTKEFILGHQLNPNVEKPVKHHILSFSPDDQEKLSPESLQDITNDYLQQIGYSNNQYVAYLHKDTQNPHLHIVVNKVDMDGKNTHLKLEKNKSRKVLMELEKKYNLTRTREQATEQSNNYDKTYTETKERLNDEGKKTDKEIIKDSIKQALEKRPLSEHYFSSFLKQQGIELIKKGRGYQFEYNGRTYKASNIDRKYSFAKLNKFFEDNYKANEDRKRKAEQYNTPKPEEKTEQQKGKTQERPKQKEKIHIPSKKEQHREMVKSLATDIAKMAEQRKLDYNGLINELSDLHKESLQAGFNYNRDDYMNRVKNMIAQNLNETEASHFESYFDDTLKGNKLNQESNQDKQKSLFMPQMTQEQKQFDDRMKTLSSNFANEIKSGNADYSSFMKKLNIEFPIAQKLGYSNSFRIFTTDIMNYVNNRLPENDLNLKTKFMQDYQTAQNKFLQDFLQDKEQDKSHLIDNQDLTQNKNKNKNKGLKL